MQAAKTTLRTAPRHVASSLSEADWIKRGVKVAQAERENDPDSRRYRSSKALLAAAFAALLEAEFFVGNDGLCAQASR